MIAPTFTSLENLLKLFPEDQYYVSHEAAIDAYQRSSLFNVIDFASGWKIDFILRKSRDFNQVEFERRAPTNLSGTIVYVAAPEDVLIAKLEWAKLADSERQIEDAAGIIRTQGNDLDTLYIDRWVQALGLQLEWNKANQKVGLS